MKKLAVEQFRSELRSGTTPTDAMVLREMGAAFETPVGNSRKVHGIFSDETVDRCGDVCKASSWRLERFNQNPFVSFNHDVQAPPIGRASATKVSAGQLGGDIEFATADVYPFADTIFKLVKGKFLNSLSVGFRPIRYQFTSDKSRPGGIDFLESELLEIAVCGIPANPSAMIQASAAGIDTREILRTMEERRSRRIAEAKTIATAARRMIG